MAIPLGVLGSSHKAAAAGITLTYVAGYATNSATVTIGAATATRTVVVLGGSQGDVALNCTIGGAAATVDYVTSGVPRSLIAARATVPSGTTVTVAGKFGGFGVWVSPDAIAPVDIEVSGLDTGMTVTLATVAGGAAAAHAASDSGAGGATWTGLTERYDLLRSHGADAVTTGANLTVSHTSYSPRFVAISYGPAA